MKTKLTDCFSGCVDIVVLGEAHGKCDQEIMFVLEENHTDLLGLLWELPVSDQSAIDEYIQSGTIGWRLTDLIEGAKREGKDIRGMIKIFDLAHQYDIPVLCIDSSKVFSEEYPCRSDHGYYFLRGESRDDDMALNITRAYMKNPGKYLVVSGADHVRWERDRETGNLTLGTRLKIIFGEKCRLISLI